MQDAAASLSVRADTNLYIYIYIGIHTYIYIFGGVFLKSTDIFGLTCRALR